MAIGYRAVFRLDDSEDAIDVAESQLRSWLKEKSQGRRPMVRVADWDGMGVHALGPSAALTVVHTGHAADESKRHVYRYVETNAGGTWRVNIYAFSLPLSRTASQTLVVEAAKDGADSAESIRDVDPPRIARNLLDTAVVRDGDTVLYGRPRFVQAGGVDEVIGAITDPLRTASVIVASSPETELDKNWSAIIESLTRQSVGVATTFVISANALEHLNGELPESHRVRAGRVRTYAPGVDLESDLDGSRHRYLGPATLARAIDRKLRVTGHLPNVHAEASRRRFAVAELPNDVRRGLELVARTERDHERTNVVRTRVEQNLTHSEIPQRVEREPVGVMNPVIDRGQETMMQALRRIVRRWLRREYQNHNDIDELGNMLEWKSVEVEAALEQLDGAGKDQEERDNRIAELERRIDDLTLDIADESARLDELERQSDYYRRRLIEVRAFEALRPAEDPELWNAPDSAEELVARLTDGADAHIVLNRVEFTGDIAAVLDVDKRDGLGYYAQAMWKYVRVLYDYAEHRAAGRFDGNLHQYLTRDDAPDGTKCDPLKHAPTESDSVMNNPTWSRERMLRVPVETNPSGIVLMNSHFKIATRDSFAPRMHYYDDVEGSGKIYVGYIGRHLTTKQS